jgi:hypothetical protein
MRFGKDACTATAAILGSEPEAELSFREVDRPEQLRGWGGDRVAVCVDAVSILAAGCARTGGGCMGAVSQSVFELCGFRMRTACSVSPLARSLPVVIDTASTHAVTISRPILSEPLGGPASSG